VCGDINAGHKFFNMWYGEGNLFRKSVNGALNMSLWLWKPKRCCFLFLWCERKFWEFVDVNFTKQDWLL